MAAEPSGRAAGNRGRVRRALPSLLAVLLLAVWPAGPGAANELHEAILARDVPRIRELVEARPELLNGLNEHGLAPIHVAAQRAPPEVIELLLTAGADVNRLSDDAWRPIDCAVNWLRDDNVAVLLANGARLDATAGVQNTPLHRAAFYGATTCAEILLDAGADLEAVNRDGEKPLHLALRRDEPEVWDLLLGRGAECDIFCAAALGMVDRVGELLDADPDAVNAEGRENTTPLHWAADKDQAEVVALLLDRGAKIDAESESGAEAIHYAAGENAVEALRVLLEHGADPNSTGRYGTALHYAASRNAVDTAELLIAAGGDVHARRADEDTPLHRAAAEGSQEVARLLIGHWANVNARGDMGMTPLHSAAWAGEAPMVPLLVEWGAKVSARDERGWTPLYTAALRGRVSALNALAEAGGDVNARDHQGWTPLLKASERGEAASVSALLARGADRTARTKEGRTPLHWAAAMGHADIVATLLKAPDAPAVPVLEPVEEGLPNVSWGGRTDSWAMLVSLIPPYHEVMPAQALPPDAPEGYLTLNYAVAHLCAQAGARWNWDQSRQNVGPELFGKQVEPEIDAMPLRDALPVLLDPEGITFEVAEGQVVLVRKDRPRPAPPGEATPLHCAAAGGHFDVCELLVEAGAALDAKDPAGKTPAMLAAENERPDVVAWLVAHGAEAPPPPEPTPPSQQQLVARALAKRVTLTPPYPDRWLGPGLSPTRLTVAVAVHAVCQQAGLKYDFAKSHANCGDSVGRYIRPELKDVPCEEALRQILEPKGMAYTLDGTTVILRWK